MNQIRRTQPAKNTLWKQVAVTCLFLVLVSILFSWIRIFLRAREVQTLLKEKKSQVETLYQKQAVLEERIETATASFELERRAREELLLQASGEAVWRIQD